MARGSLLGVVVDVVATVAPLSMQAPRLSMPSPVAVVVAVAAAVAVATWLS